MQEIHRNANGADCSDARPVSSCARASRSGTTPAVAPVRSMPGFVLTA